MNFIGDFGNFIVENQEQIGIVLVVLLVVIGLILLIKALLASHRKQRILSQIQETVTEINSAVSNLNEKKSDVIYIDNRTSEQRTAETVAHTGAPKEAKSAEMTVTETPEADILRKIAEISHGGTDAAPARMFNASEKASKEQSSAEARTSEEPVIPKKFFSRDCGTSKNGRVYTAEELAEQIKE